VEFKRGISRSFKGAGALLASFLLVTVLAVNYASAQSVAKTTWKKTWLVASTSVTLKTLVSTPSTGTKTWSVSGSCSLNKAKSAIVVKSTGSCTVTLRVTQKGKYKAAKVVKKFVIRPKGYVGSDTSPVTTLAPGAGTGSGSNTGTGTSAGACESSGSSVIATSVSSEPVKAAAAVAVSDATVYYTPAPFTQTLTKSLPGKTLTSLAVLCDRAKFLISTSSTAELSNQYFAIDNSFAASTSVLTAQTYGSYLHGIFSAVADAADATQFSIESQLHSVYTLDYVPSQGNKLNFAINHAKTSGTPGYVTFTYNKTTKILQAKKRYVLNTTTYTHSLDSSFAAANYYVNVANGVYSLVASAASATPLHFFNSPIDFDIPSAFNPSAVKLVPNPRVSIASYIASEDPIVEMEGVLLPNGTRDTSRTKLQNITKTIYRNQIAAAGVNAATKAAADAVLLAIKSDVEAEGGRLRYDIAMYRNFRDQALAGILESASIANGVVGQHTVPFVYFTNEADDSGKHHPFMVMASYNTSDKPNGLNDIRRPPGAMPTATCNKYDCNDVTRDAVSNLVMSKIPMRDYGLVSNVEENSFGSRPSLKSDARYTGASNTYNWASRAANGIAADGMLIYPAFNNNLAQSQVVGEICVIGAHVGQGMGLHYHADGHAANKNGMHLYNSDDYVGKAHPPIIGFGYDGVALSGVYDVSYPNMVGYNTPLDDFGGHNHDGLGYHYHAHGAVGTTTTGKTYDLHLLLNGAWRGRINDVPNFWPDNTSIGEPEINMGQNNRYVGRGVS